MKARQWVGVLGACAGVMAGSPAAATTYTYYGNGRVHTVHYDNGTQITYNYDNAGNRTQVVSGAASAQPNASNFTETLNTGTPSITFDPRSNATAPHGDPMTVNSPITDALFGTAVVNGGTSVTYTPALPLTANPEVDNLAYSVQDTSTGFNSNAATVIVTINDTAPTAGAINLQTPVLRNQTTSIPVQSFISSPSGQSMLITAVTQGTHQNSQGTYGKVAYSSDGTQLRYTPPVWYAGPDSFTYTVTDNLGVVSSVGTVTLNVTAANSPPVANKGIYQMIESNLTYETFNIGAPGSGPGDVFLSDTDADGDPIYITGVSHISGSIDATVAPGAYPTTIEIDCTTKVAQGDPPAQGSFTYTISDGFTTSHNTIGGGCTAGISKQVKRNKGK